MEDVVGVIVLPTQLRCRRAIVPSDRRSALIACGEIGELQSEPGSFHLAEPKVLTDVDMDVLLGHAVDAASPNCFGQLSVRRCYESAVANATNVLRRIKGVRDRDAGTGAHRSMRLRGIFDDRNVAVTQLVNVAWPAVEMNGDDCARPVGNGLTNAIGIDERRVGQNIDRHRPCARGADRRSGWDCRECGNDDFVSRPDAEPFKDELQRRRPARHSDSAGSAESRGCFCFEGCQLGAE